MKKILVTCGTGYIGSHTAIELMAQGYEPLLIDNLSNSKLERLDQIASITGKKPAFEQIEMCDEKAMDDLFQRHSDIAAVIHFAAVLQVGESVEQPLFYYRNNLTSTLNLLDCMKKYGISPVVFSSSCTVYGNPDSLPVTEHAPIKEAVSPYGNTKKMCEDILRDASLATNIRTISLRYFNPIGNHPSALIGEEPHGIPTHLVPYLTQTARGIRPHLNIFGNDYATPDGTCVRDYLHVVDLAKAHIAAIERQLNGHQEKAYEVFNIGTGTGFSVLQMVKAFENATGEKVPYQFAPRRPGDVEAVYADTSAAEQKLGWKATLGLEDMFRSAWEWEQKLTH
ncbi:MAG: UDP-glucose 4-epimerase GalE [Bacteroidota bacterium]|nr:UDP-glucose 4-epimerase GalE [Bacteroidota bacterium]MDX5430609.1 UDP-glucose 4-epimerase GalE [Bacteroidota bacterium]MDX5469361.1 UDP-glucose 4-epimerase GalE [Bacteroidota bacterium]